MVRVWEFIIPARPTPFNFLNGIGIRIILNKQDGVGMGATHPEPTPLQSLSLIYSSAIYQILIDISQKYQ